MEGEVTPERDGEHSPVGGAQHLILPPTSEHGEPSTAELDGAFEDAAQGGKQGAGDEKTRSSNA